MEEKTRRLSQPVFSQMQEKALETWLTLEEMLDLADRIPNEMWDISFGAEIMFSVKYIGFKVSIGERYPYGQNIAFYSIQVWDLGYYCCEPGYSDKQYCQIGYEESKENSRLRELFEKVEKQCIQKEKKRAAWFGDYIKKRIKNIKEIIKTK